MKIKSFVLFLLAGSFFSCNKSTVPIVEEAPPLQVDLRYQPRFWQACFGLKDDLHKSVIAYDGRLWYDFVNGNNHIGFPYANFCYERNKGYGLSINAELVGDEWLAEQEQTLLAPEFPIITNTGQYGKLAFQQTVWASYGDEGDLLGSRYDYCDVKVTNEGNAPEETQVRIVFNSIYPVRLDESRRQVYLLKGGEEVLLCSFPAQAEELSGHISKMKYTYYLDFPKITLQAGEQARLPFVIYRSPTESGMESLPDPEEDLEKMRIYWRGLDLPYDKIVVPDTGIQKIINASVRNIYQAREIKEGIAAFQVGPTFYRGTWAVDGPFFMEAMTYLGQKEEVRNYIEGIFEVGETQGARGRYFSKQAGLRLWMVWRHAQLTGDDEWLEKMWPIVSAEVDNIRQYRALSFEDNTELNDGLMPLGTPDGGIGGLFAEYTNNYWVLSGMHKAVDAARHLGKEEAEDWQQLYDELYDQFNIARERDKKTDELGNMYVPTFMGEENTLNPTSGQWAFLHSIFPGKIYESEDALMRGTLAMLDANLVEGLIWGTGWLPRGLWTYSASFHGHAHLWLGHGERVPQIIYDFANHISPMLCWSEEQHPVDYPGEYLMHGDMPHNWASVDFIRLIRHALVLERGNELHFFEGLPKVWLSAGDRIELNDVYTDFGLLSLSLEVGIEGNFARLDITMDDTAHDPPSAIVLHESAFGRTGETTELQYEPKIELDITLE